MGHGPFHHPGEAGSTKPGGGAMSQAGGRRTEAGAAPLARSSILSYRISRLAEEVPPGNIGLESNLGAPETGGETVRPPADPLLQ